MQFLITAIVASVIVSVLLKFFSRWGVDIRVAVGSNYLMCIILTWFLLRPKELLGAFHSPISSAIAILLGVLLPAVFVVMYRGVQSVGVVRADVAQRLSLFLSLAAAFFIFGSNLNKAKIIGLVLAIIALFLLMMRSSNTAQNRSGRGGSSNSADSNTGRSAFWLIGIWLGYGVIDILFKTMSKHSVGFTSTLLATFVLALIFMWIYIAVQRLPINVKSLGAGLFLGVFNFVNIWAYVMAHVAFKTNAALVFATMNIGVMALALIVGSLLLRERLNQWNVLGILCAFLSIFVMWFLGGF